MRYEPAFFAKYVASLYTKYKVSATEAYARGMSWGLMQVMGQVARENGFTDHYLSGLCDPAAGVDLGAAYCAKSWTQQRATPRRAFFSGTAAPTRTIPLKSSRAARVTFERPADSLCTTFQCATGFISQLPELPC